MQDSGANQVIVQLALHPTPDFRATAAWIMGKTRDPQFRPEIDALSHDLYALVRRNAAKALRAISEY